MQAHRIIVAMAAGTLLGALPARAAAPDGVELTRDGQSQAVIVLPESPSVEIRHAAQELTEYVRRISGAKLRVGTPGADGPAIVLRIDPQLNPVPAGQRDWAGGRGWRLRSEGRRLELCGGDGLGVLHAVYALLERHLGVRWLWPGDLGEVVPEQPSIRLAGIDETSRPDFAVRWVGSGDWALRQGANAMVAIDKQPVGVRWKWHFHSFSTLIPAEKYYAGHPDWWPLVHGKRQEPTQPHSHSTQLCTTNPEMVAEMIRNLLAVLDGEPDLDIIALSPNDGYGFCECARCQALDEPGRGWFARYSKRLAVLNQQIAAAVAQRHPRVLVKVGAYAMYLLRPLDEKLAPAKNELVQSCHIYACHNHPLEGDGCVAGKTFQPSDEFMPNAAFRQTIDDWKRAADHLFIYEYYTLGGPSKAGLLWPMVHTLRRDMPYYHRVGAEGFYTQLTDTEFHRFGMNYYLAAKLAWDCRQDVDALMADYCRAAFGPAAQPMLAYFQRLEQAMVDSDLCISYGLKNADRFGPKVFTEPVLRDAQQLLEQARQAVPAGTHRKRVEFFAQGFEQCRTAVAAIAKKKR